MRALDKLHPGLAPDELRRALKAGKGHVACRVEQAIYLGAAGTQHLGESSLRNMFLLHGFFELPGDDPPQADNGRLCVASD